MQRILIWGTGTYARSYMSLGEVSGERLAGFIETRRSADTFMDRKIYEPHEAAQLEYDRIIVCVIECEAIYRAIKACGIDMDKVIFIKNTNMTLGDGYSQELLCITKLNDRQDDGKIAEEFPLLYENFIKPLNTYDEKLMLCWRYDRDIKDKTNLLAGKDFQRFTYKSEYIRYRTFEINADEIEEHGVSGAVAELGVYQGDFARLINARFPDRKLYLFDTFEGFDDEELSVEIAAGNCDREWAEFFKNTSVERVMGNLLHPETVVVRKGLFPGTLEEMPEERYAFVSIDVDFEKSIYEGLKYFYPRMNEGGRIFVHDYNSSYLAGVKKAVRRYEQETGERLAGVPLCDNGGTLVIYKYNK